MRYAKWIFGLFLIVFILVCAVILIRRNVNRPTWKEFSSDDGKFSVLMLGTPREETTQVGGKPFRSYSCQLQKDTAYRVIYADIPDETLKKEEPDYTGKFLDDACRGLEGRFKGEFKSAKRISVGEYPGREVEIAAPDNVYYRARVYLVKNRYYQVLAQGPKGTIDAEPTTKFLDSFKVQS